MTASKAAASLGFLLVVFGIGALAFSANSFPESVSIARNVASFDELTARFQTLAEKKGASYAFEVLRRAELPPGTDLHLLGHIVGDALYAQEGPEGIALCTQEFRNACSHSIVIGALDEFGGEPALERIREACKAAPGGSGAYTMCYHGLGHGIFAFYGYDLEPTIALCKKTGTPDYNEREYIECVGGAVMELMGGGGHDRELWLKSRARYLSENDPLSPCSTEDMPYDLKGVCYTYLTPHLFESAGADLAMPGPEHFEKAFQYCDHISASDTASRYACFSGIGKEFPGLTLSRDIRKVNETDDEALNLMHAWCSLAPHAESYEACVGSIVDSLFWGGENDAAVSVRFCTLSPERGAEECFAHLSVIGAQYLQEQDFRALCARLPREHVDACLARSL